MPQEKPDLTNTEATRVGTIAGKDEVILRELVIDGIQEYDQKLPNWWLFTLYGAIIYFIGYWVISYTLKIGKSDELTIDAQIAQLEERRAAALKSTVDNLTDEILLTQWAVDPDIVAKGKENYMQICHSCHGVDLSATLEGTPLPGRPLNDGNWQYGKAPLAIFKMINEGTPEGSTGLNGMIMVPRGGLDLSAQQVAEITAFLLHENAKYFEGSTFDENGKFIE